MTDNGIITLGDFREYPREHWGSEDWKKHDALKEMSRRLQSTGPIESPPLHTLSVNVAGEDREGDARRRRQRVDRLLEKHGLRERRWT